MSHYQTPNGKHNVPDYSIRSVMHLEAEFFSATLKAVKKPRLAIVPTPNGLVPIFETSS